MEEQIAQVTIKHTVTLLTLQHILPVRGYLRARTATDGCEQFRGTQCCIQKVRCTKCLRNQLSRSWFLGISIPTLAVRCVPLSLCSKPA